jgi:hypothetical protein
MSVKVVIICGNREVSVETSSNSSVEAVVDQALSVWRRSRPRQAKPTITAGGMGFQADLAPPPVDEELRRS